MIRVSRIIIRCGRKFRVCLLIWVVVWNIVIMRLISRFGIISMLMIIVVSYNVLWNRLSVILGVMFFFSVLVVC